MRLLTRLTASQPWKAVIRHGLPRDRRTRALAISNNLFLHLHPVTIRRDALRLSFTWCMGGLAFFLFLVEALTGILLMFYYRPTIEYAYQDMQALRAHVAFGILREIHRWGGHAMVIAVWLHMLRVFLTGSYKPPREFNWIVGVALLVLTMLLSFTGYLLPWDQLAMWAITVGTNMAKAAPLVGADGPLTPSSITATSDLRFLLLGSSTVGENALLRFYVLHCVLLPLISAILCAIHFWRTRKDGISTPL
jgi:quinol-cytochrome oxidoreductase complex cytochrome b subunit